jgi:hypothetical protein
MGLICSVGKKFFCSPKCADWLWHPCSLLFKGYPTHFMLGVKWAKCECHHVPPSSAEVKNEWNYSSNTAVCLHVVYRDNCTFIFTYALFIRLAGDLEACCSVFNTLLFFLVTTLSTHNTECCTSLKYGFMYH